MIINSSSSSKTKIFVQNITCIISPTQLVAGLYLGNAFGAQNTDILQQYGIRAVLTASIQTPIHYNPIQIPFHIKIKAHDKQNYQILPHLEQCLDFIHKYRQITNVFVHCYAGISRSVTIIIAYLIKYFKFNLNTALSFVQNKRIVAKPNIGFMEQLKKYQNTMKDILFNNLYNLQSTQQHQVYQRLSKSPPITSQNTPISQRCLNLNSPNHCNLTTNQYIGRTNQIKSILYSSNSKQNINNGIKNPQVITNKKHNYLPPPRIFSITNQKYLNQQVQQFKQQFTICQSNNSKDSKIIQITNNYLNDNKNNHKRQITKIQSAKNFMTYKNVYGC